MPVHQGSCLTPKPRLQKVIGEEASVEALDEGILRRLAGGDVVPLDAGLLAPAPNRYRGELGAVVGHDRPRSAAQVNDAVQPPSYAQT
jgi:hypothetical protein